MSTLLLKMCCIFTSTDTSTLMEITDLRNQAAALQDNNNVLQNLTTDLRNTNTDLEVQVLGLQIACGVLGALLLIAIILIILLLIYFAVSSKVKGSNVSYFMFRNNNYVFCIVEPP